MKKYLAFISAFFLLAGLFAMGRPARAATVTNITPSIANPVPGQPYLARVRFWFDGVGGPNVIVSGLPPGIILQNPSPGVFNTIYALNQRETDGSYFVDLYGTAAQSGFYNVQFYFFDATHTFDVYKYYSLTVGAVAGAQTGQSGAVILPLIRLYSKSFDDHFYTTDRNEAQHAALSGGYRIEGDMGYVYSPHGPNADSTASLWRLYNPRNRHHFYTTDSSEMLALLQRGFVMEGGGAIAYMPGSAQGLPVYRLRSPRSGDHFYTVSLSEYVTAVASGYIAEGILGGRLLP